MRLEVGIQSCSRTAVVNPAPCCGGGGGGAAAAAAAGVSFAVDWKASSVCSGCNAGSSLFEIGEHSSPPPLIRVAAKPNRAMPREARELSAAAHCHAATHEDQGAHSVNSTSPHFIHDAPAIAARAQQPTHARQTTSRRSLLQKDG